MPLALTIYVGKPVGLYDNEGRLIAKVKVSKIENNGRNGGTPQVILVIDAPDDIHIRRHNAKKIPAEIIKEALDGAKDP